MIRFVRMSYEDTGCRFAFWDTTVDRFIEFGGVEGWASVSDFMFYLDKQNLELGNRCLGLIPSNMSYRGDDDDDE